MDGAKPESVFLMLLQSGKPFARRRKKGLAGIQVHGSSGASGLETRKNFQNEKVLPSLKEEMPKALAVMKRSKPTVSLQVIMPRDSPGLAAAKTKAMTQLCKQLSDLEKRKQHDCQFAPYVIPQTVPSATFIANRDAKFSCLLDITWKVYHVSDFINFQRNQVNHNTHLLKSFVTKFFSVENKQDLQVDVKIGTYEDLGLCNFDHVQS
ncbi:hypothetical protein BC830DRAFT_1146513 [Chytriomyces sp. MP71]|nr:hypothetical protein BC830DRAFT_1146513 [Chytriomyces sp. MP71]